MIRMYFGVGILALAGGAMAVDQYNLSTNYTEVEGKVTSTKVDCYVEGGRSKLVEKETNQMAYMSCAEAEAAAVEFGYKPKDVHRRVELSYNYRSPVDGNMYTGTYTDSDADEGEYKKGGALMVHAHIETPDESRIR
jgi:hypothetical protein